MLRYSKPRRAWLTWKQKGLEPGWVNGEPDKYFEDEEGLNGVYDYCANDVEAEYLLDKAVPDLIPVEREIWLLNQAMNLRGVRVDTETAQIVLDLIKVHVGELEKELQELTDGAVTTVGQRDKLLEWLEDNGITLPNLAIKTVLENLDALKTDTSKAKRVLEIRAALAKSSTKKYQAILGRAGRNGRVCDIAMYHGAHTGRESGTGLQLQNLPRGTIKDTDKAINALQTGDATWIRALYGNPMEVYSSCIRGMVKASPNHLLYVADYNAIEARVLAWLAGDEKALENFRKGRDPYVLMACAIFNVRPEDVTFEQRQIGKIAELGLGYQMGAAKFMQTCINFGVKDMTLEIAERAVKTYRAKHSPISGLWPRMERAAIAAVSRPQRAVKLNRVAWGRDKRSLWCELPSGRRIHYQAPEIRQEPAPWGEYRPKLYYWSVNSLTKKWECSASYGGLLVENIVQATARDINLWAALRMEKKGYTFLAQVHDELISESPKGDVLEYEKILMEGNPWSRDLPVVAKGFSSERYRK
jgi:DNA polymerase